MRKLNYSLLSSVLVQRVVLLLVLLLDHDSCQVSVTSIGG